MSDKFASYIGLAQRAGAVAYGEDIIVEKLRTIALVLIDGDAPAKYSERLRSRTASKPTYTVSGLKAALHKDNVNAIGIMNKELAAALIQLLR